MWLLLVIPFLSVTPSGANGLEPTAPPANPAEPMRDELPLGEIVLGLSTDRSVYSPREPVLVEFGIGNTSDQGVTLNTVVLMVTGGEGVIPTAMEWLPGKVRILNRRGREVWDSTAYLPPGRAARQRNLAKRSLVWFTFLWPQVGPAWEIVRPGEYMVETQFLLSKEGWKGGFPILRLPITVSEESLHPSCEVEKEGLTWRVDMDKAETQPGQVIRLKLTVANVGKEPVTIWWHHQLSDSYFVISDSQGKEVWTSRVTEEEEHFQPLWPTAITFPPGESKLVALGQWDGRIEVSVQQEEGPSSSLGGVEEGAEEKKQVDAPLGEYTVKTIRGFPSMPVLEDLKFSIVAP